MPPCQAGSPPAATVVAAATDGPGTPLEATVSPAARISPRTVRRRRRSSAMPESCLDPPDRAFRPSAAIAAATGPDRIALLFSDGHPSDQGLSGPPGGDERSPARHPEPDALERRRDRARPLRLRAWRGAHRAHLGS